ncbi:MAG: dockerin type I repeat-containing protein [Ruminococcus sp.]|nr:dockerin type I repeat-containing protein [Ruminococcus sp.]
MKKLLCIILAITILTGILILPVSAVSQNESGKYVEQFEQYLTNLGYNPYYEGEKQYMYSELYEYYSDTNTSDTPDWVLVAGGSNMVSPAGCNGIFDEYNLTLNNIYHPYSLLYHVYVPSQNKFYTLSDAWTERLEGLDNAFTEYLVPNKRAELIKDSDGDGVITEKDAEKYGGYFAYYNSFEAYKGNIYFDATNCGWQDFEKVYCNFQTKDGSYIFEVNSADTECTNFSNNSIYRYDLKNILPEFDKAPTLTVTFSNENGDTTEPITMAKGNRGDIIYCTGEFTDDENKKPVLSWTKEADYEMPKLKSVKEALKDAEEEKGDIETNRYYFLMPNGKNGERGKQPDQNHYNEFSPSWYNKYTSSAGIWWGYSEQMSAGNWPGLAMETTSYNDIFYAYVPKDVSSLMFNNTIEDGFFNDDSLKEYEHFTTDVPACGYEEGQSDLYPDGLDSFDNMIFVIEPYTPSIIELSENALKECHGEWYYYYGSGCYGTDKDGIKTYDCIRDDHNHTQKSAKDIIAEYEAKTGEKVETNRYYFLMPNGSNGKKGAEGYAENWYNKYSKGASISWWDSKIIDSSNYPGNTMEHDTATDVYYADVPKDVTMISINNSLNRGYDKEALIHSLAKQIDPVPCEYYDPGESELYPEGVDSFDNMIYVIDPDRYSERSSSKFYEGEWYYYYGDGCYGTVKDGNTDNCIRGDHCDENGKHIATDFIIGDADGDGELSIMDATEIQLIVAKLKEMTADIKTTDADKDNEVTILDATAIQLKLA